VYVLVNLNYCPSGIRQERKKGWMWGKQKNKSHCLTG